MLLTRETERQTRLKIRNIATDTAGMSYTTSASSSAEVADLLDSRNRRREKRHAYTYGRQTYKTRHRFETKRPKLDNLNVMNTADLKKRLILVQPTRPAVDFLAGKDEPI